MTGAWNVQLEDGQHSIRVEHSPWACRLKVFFDNNEISRAYVFVLLGDIHQFDARGHHFVVSVKGYGYWGGHLALSVDGREVQPGGFLAPTPTPQQQIQQPPTALPPSTQFIQEVNVVETSEVYRTEEYPFDNTFGDSELSTEREISEESTNEFSTETNNQANAKAGFNIMQVLTAEVAAQVSNKVGHRIGEKVVESQTLRLAVRPHSSVVYHIIWKRKIRSGEFLYMVNGSVVSIPYRMKYGLSVEVKTRLHSQAGKLPSN